MAKMGIKTEDRVTAKKECLRMIARLKLDPARTKLLSSFVDSYIRLLEAERKKLDAEMQKLPLKEKEEVMELMTSWKEEGIEIGVQREIDFVLRLIKKRFGNLREITEKSVRTLPIDKAEELGVALFDFKDAKDLENWLNRASKNN